MAIAISAPAFESPFGPLFGGLPGGGKSAVKATPRFSVLEGDDAEFSWWTSRSTDVFGNPWNVFAEFSEAYNVTATYEGPRLEGLDVEDVSFSTILVPTTVEALYATDLFASSLDIGSVREFQGDDLFFVDLEFGHVGEGEVDNVILADIAIGALTEEFRVDDGYLVTMEVGYAYWAEVSVDDTDGFTGWFRDFINSDFDAHDSSGVDTWFEDADGGHIHYHDVDGGSVTVDEGEVDVHVHESDGILVDLSRNDDESYVHVRDSGWEDDVVALGGSGDDYFNFNDSRVAYNSGDGSDYVNVRGGQTVGNSVDGWADTLVFNGGQHSVQLDQLDRALIDTGSGMWDVASLDMIDGNRNGTAVWGDTEVTFHVTPVHVYADDMMLG